MLWFASALSRQSCNGLLQATVALENEASYKVLEKNCFVREGLLRQAKFVREWRDYYIYSFLREDYMALAQTEKKERSKTFYDKY